MKYLKNFSRYLLLTIIASTLYINNVLAYGYDISVTSSTVTVGNSVTLKIQGSQIAGRFNITSSNTGVASLSTSSIWVENDTQSITINAKKVGTATITITPNDITTTDTNPKDVSLSAKTITITVKAKPTSSGSSSSGGNSQSTTPTKSTNSYLSSITVDGFELNEEFDKESLEYTLTVPYDTEKIKINAQLEDSNAKVTGVGEVNVSTGLNTFEIIVTAENGSKRTYNLKVTVEEEDPIEVKIDNETLTVIRKRKDLPKISEYFEEKDITIDNKNVEGYYNDTLKYTVVGLKNSLGEINYYIYDSGKYTKYEEYTFNGTTLQVLDKAVSGAKKTNFVYDSSKITSYQEVKLDVLKNTYALDNNDIGGNQFYLFYAINIETGKESLYQYDASEKTVQRYNTLVLDMYKDRSDKYYLCLLGSLLLLGIVILTFSITMIHKKKQSKKKINLVKEKPSKKIIDEEQEKFSFDDLPIKNKTKRQD